MVSLDWHGRSGWRSFSATGQEKWEPRVEHSHTEQELSNHGVLEETLESPLDSKENKPIDSEGNQP